MREPAVWRSLILLIAEWRSLILLRHQLLSIFGANGPHPHHGKGHDVLRVCFFVKDNALTPSSLSLQERTLLPPVLTPAVPHESNQAANRANTS